MLNDPFPPTWTEGMPSADPSHVSCTVAWPKFVPDTVTTDPAGPVGCVSARLGAAFAASVIAGSPANTATSRTMTPNRAHSRRRNPASDPGRAGCAMVTAEDHALLPRRVDPPAAMSLGLHSVTRPAPFEPRWLCGPALRRVCVFVCRSRRSRRSRWLAIVQGD